MRKLILGLTVCGCVSGNAMGMDGASRTDTLVRQRASLLDLLSEPVDEAATQRRRSYSDGDIDQLKATLRDQAEQACKDPSIAANLQETWNKLYQAVPENGNNFQDLTACCVSLLEYIQSKNENSLSEDDFIIDDVAVDMFAEINCSLLHYSVTFGRMWAIDRLKALMR